MKNLVLSRVLVLSLFTMLCSFTAFAKEYIVDKSTFGAALLKVSPGDTVVFKNGTYSNMALNLTKSGTKEQPIVIRAATIGGVVFNGDISSFTLKADYNIIDGFKWADIKTTSSTSVLMFSGASNNTFRNNTIINSGRTTSGSKTGILRLMKGSKNNILEYNRFDNLINMGIQVWAYGTDNDNTGNIIRYNHFVNHKGLEFLQLGQGGSSAFIDQYSLVEHNLFEDFDMQDPELISSKTSHNTIRHNTFRNCFSMVTLRTGEGTRVEGNWFFNSHGIRVHDKNHVVINNYIEGVSAGGYSGDDEGIVLYCGNMQRPTDDGSHYPADSVLVANNTVVNHINQHILVGKNSSSWAYKPTGCIIKNNLVMNNVGTAYTNEASVGISWLQNIAFSSANGSVGNVGNVLKSDPLLSLDGGIYKLQQGSPAIDNASPEDTVSIDIEGQPRNVLDIGADEYSGSEILYVPLDATMVGPGTLEGLTKFVLNTSMSGLGTIEIDPVGNTFDSLAVITLKATPMPGYLFERWSGDTSGSDTEVTVTMNANKEITATFTPLSPIIPIDSLWASTDDGNKAENTIDNNLTTRWSAEGDPQSITFKFDSLYSVDYLMIAWFKGDERNSAFKIATSLNGEIWDTITTASASGTTLQQEMFDVENVNARFLKYIGNGNSANDWNSITELDIHGTLATNTGFNENDRMSGSKEKLFNFPNPFSTHTTIAFDTAEAGKVSLEIYNLLGRKIEVLENGFLPAGSHSYSWPTSKSMKVTKQKSGIYICRLITPSGIYSHKLIFKES